MFLFSHSLNRGAAFLALIAVLLPEHVSAGEKAHVVLATHGDAPVARGDVLDGSEQLILGQGAEVTTLSRSGALFRMTGPCHCTLPPADAAIGGQAAIPKKSAGTRAFLLGDDLWAVALPALKDLVTRSAARDGSDVPAPAPAQPPTARPGLWEMPVERSGDHCVRRGEVMLWRESVAKELSFSLRARSLQQKGIVWAAGQRTVRLPDHFVSDGAPMVLELDGRAYRLVLHVLPQTIDEGEWGEVLIWMAARNCRRQAQFLVDGLNDGSLFPERERRPGLSEL